MTNGRFLFESVWMILPTSSMAGMSYTKTLRQDIISSADKRHNLRPVGNRNTSSVFPVSFFSTLYRGHHSS